LCSGFWTLMRNRAALAKGNQLNVQSIADEISVLKMLT
jgi:hypothetical protein